MSVLSVIIITQNEAINIATCLQSVQFADEIIILDSGSTDETVTIARTYTDKVYRVDWPGYGTQKNRALQKATGDWVLSIDADEVVTPELGQEIKKILTHPHTFDGYFIRRKSKYCHQMIQYGDWKNDKYLRLFKRGKAQFKEVPVHEELIINGNTSELNSCLIHNSLRNLEEVLLKMNAYSSLSAGHKYHQGNKSGLLTAVVRGTWTFVRGYILKLGFLDGKKGFMLAVSNAEGCYYRYLKLMLLQEKVD
jgi:glycosyltransferase involved in cell wall biosynthesis